MCKVEPGISKPGKADQDHWHHYYDQPFTANRGWWLFARHARLLFSHLIASFPARDSWGEGM